MRRTREKNLQEIANNVSLEANNKKKKTQEEPTQDIFAFNSTLHLSGQKNAFVICSSAGTQISFLPFQPLTSFFIF